MKFPLTASSTSNSKDLQTALTVAIRQGISEGISELFYWAIALLMVAAIALRPAVKVFHPQQPGQVTTTSGSSVERLRHAIIGQESGANFQAVNPHSGALGFAQLMPENVGPWSQEALGHAVSPDEFLNSPDLQLQIIDFKLNQYFQQALKDAGGDEATAVRRVASQWYSGNPDWYTSTAPQYYDGNAYPSIADYTLSVLDKFNQG